MSDSIKKHRAVQLQTANKMNAFYKLSLEIHKPKESSCEEIIDKAVSDKRQREGEKLLDIDRIKERIDSLHETFSY